MAAKGEAVRKTVEITGNSFIDINKLYWSRIYVEHRSCKLKIVLFQIEVNVKNGIDYWKDLVPFFFDLNLVQKIS